jgi:hypothetical protein
MNKIVNSKLEIRSTKLEQIQMTKKNNIPNKL